MYCLRERDPVLEIYERLVQLWSKEEADWYVPGVALALTPSIKTLKPEALDAMGRLISLTRPVYSTRSRLDKILSYWREFERAPVRAEALRS